MLANHAKRVSSDFNKGAKWELIIRNKITPTCDFQQTFFFLQTNGTGVCHIFWAPHPNFGLPKFENVFLSAIRSNNLCAGHIIVPILHPKPWTRSSQASHCLLLHPNTPPGRMAPHLSPLSHSCTWEHAIPSPHRHPTMSIPIRRSLA